MGWVPLWCKSNYSFLEGASHPAELVDRAADLGLGTLALTDRHGVYGSVRAHEQAKARGLTLVHGAQISLSPDSVLVLLAEDAEGWASLCSLLTEGHRDQPKGGFTLTAEAAAARSKGLTALWRPLRAARPREAELAPLARAFEGRFHALMARHRWTDDPLLERDTLAWAGRFGLVPVAAPEILYHDRGRQELQNTLTAIRHRVRLADAGLRLQPNAEHALKGEDEVRELYADRPEWVDRTVEVAARCRFSLADLDYRYPVEGVPEGRTTMGWLRKLTEEGAGRRYPTGVPEAVGQQVEKELELIEELGYAGYFLTMHDLVKFCREKEILCQGRGSAANSAVCYCLHITAVDPTTTDLLFERFLSRERAEPPDIDLDIGHRRREEVIQHLYGLYGRGRAAMVANVVCYRPRSALREVGRALDIPEAELDRAAKLLSHYGEGGDNGAALFAHAELSVPAEVRERLFRLAFELQGFPRHLSIHPGGFLLGSGTLDKLVPVEPATMPGRTVVQWDKTDVEALGLFKVDLLGLGALTHLDLAFQLLRRHRGLDLSMATLPKADPEVYDMLGRADTIGVFQIESRAQMSMLPRLKPRDYYDLVIEISLVRPGPITGGMVHPYLRRRQGLEEVTYPHELLEPVLKKTLGIPLFQEQVMKLAMVAAAYTPGEADQLRRDMAAWKSTGRIERHRETLVERMVAKGIAREFAERVFDQIKGFGEYGFPESHAASFAHIAYATAWLKCRHPDVFACALLNAWPMGFYAPVTILGDARRHGVPVLPSDLSFSGWDCTLEPVEGKARLGLRVGLRFVRGLGKTDAGKILAARRPGQSLAEWKARTPGLTEAWEKLALAGALAGLGVGRRDALWSVLDTAEPDALGWEAPAAPDFEPLGSAGELQWDYELLGHSARSHLLGPHRDRLRREGYLSAAQVAASGALPRVKTAGLVTCRQRPGTAKGVVFLTLEDESGMANLVIWERVWRQYRKTILTARFLAAEGPLQEQDGVVHLVARKFWVPEGYFEAADVPDVSRNFR